MSAFLAPVSLLELTEAVRSMPHLIAVGSETKPRLSAGCAAKLSMVRLRGILEYDPGEFTMTALAGTPMREIVATLAERGQYLPFDPLYLESGATWGGTVAAGLHGPGRFRYGGIRDFILAIKFVNGLGHLLTMGSKVVKNAAGFDLPKFFVGSLGRYGVLTEITSKVFPKPSSQLTLKIPCGNLEVAAELFKKLSNTRWEPEALDLLPGGKTMGVRLAGPELAIEQISRDILSRWPGEKVAGVESEEIWRELREFRWAHAQGLLIKVVLTPSGLSQLGQVLTYMEGVRFHVSTGGHLAYVSLPNQDGFESLHARFQELRWPAMTIRGNSPLWLGYHEQLKISDAVKGAMDPQNRFPKLEESHATLDLH